MDPSSFWAALAVDSTLFLLQAAVFAAIFTNVEEIRGWTAWHSVFFVGTFTLIDGLFMCSYFFGLIGLPELIMTGNLDYYLVKPMNALAHLAFRSFDAGSIFIALPAIGLLTVSGSALGLPMNPMTLISYAMAIMLMLILVFDLMVLIRVPAFRFKRLSSLQTAENALIESAFRVPGRLWTGFFRVAFCVILPYGIIATFPAEVFFGTIGLAQWAETIAIVSVFSLLARLGWKAGLRRYSGAGS
jgi:ABC-2 type transport system permease protein